MTKYLFTENKFDVTSSICSAQHDYIYEVYISVHFLSTRTFLPREYIINVGTHTSGVDLMKRLLSSSSTTEIIIIESIDRLQEYTAGGIYSRGLCEKNSPGLRYRRVCATHACFNFVRVNNQYTSGTRLKVTITTRRESQG